MIPPERIFVCTASVHAPLVREDLPDLPAANIIGEPVGRDTANAVGYTAAVLHKMDPDAVCAVVTADHVIQPIEAFQTALQKGFDATIDHPNALVTFGIVPTFGHTGLGYVHRGEPLVTTKKLPGVYRVLAFKEKPDKPTADRYVESGRYYWNSGMFVWRADTVLAELAAHLPDSYAGLSEIAAAWGTPQQAQVVDTVYAGLKKIVSTTPSWSRPARARGRPRWRWSRCPCSGSMSAAGPAWPRRCRPTSTTTPSRPGPRC